MNKILNLTLAALDRGWSVVPVKCTPPDDKGKVKKPASVKWVPFRDERPKKSFVLSNWKEKLTDEPGVGYGIICGEISNLFVLDMDTEEAKKKVDEYLDGIDVYTVKTPTGGYHYYFLHVDGFDNQASVGVLGLDYRTYGGYVVGPGSTFLDGSEYELISDPGISRIPEELKEFLLKSVQIKKDGGEPQQKKNRRERDNDWFDRIVIDGFSEGQRVDQLKRAIGLLSMEGRSEDYIYHMVNMINQKSDPPLPQRELDEQSRMMIRKFKNRDEKASSDIDEMVLRLNERYAQITIGGKPMILRFKDEENFDLIQPAAMKAETRHLIQWFGKKKYQVSTLWEESENRRRYQDIIFNPSLEPQVGWIDGDNGPYNLWRGFTVEPKQGDWSLFRKHIEEIMAPGYGQYVIKWLARMFQDPGGRRPGKVLVFRGIPGSGKSFTRKIIGNLLGPHYYKTDDIQHLIGRFNNAVSNVIFLAMEEAMWAGDRSQVGKLKDRITSRTLAIERKGIDIITIDNHLNMWMNSNEKWVVPVQDADRRFVVFDVLGTRANDQDYFQAIQDQMESGGYEAMLYDLLREPWTMGELIESPKTKAGFDQYSRDNSHVKQFALQCLIDGRLHPIHRGWKTIMIKQKLYESYEAFCRRHNYTYIESYSAFLNDIQEYLPYRKTRRRVGKLYGGERSIVNCIELPPLDLCRAHFSEEYEVEWEAPEIPDEYNSETRQEDFIDAYEAHYKDF